MLENPTSAQVPGHPGEDLMVLERVVVAPSMGVFSPIEGADQGGEGSMVEAGQAIGVIESSGSVVEVRSPFRGWLMGMLALKGERLRKGEPVAWLRVVVA